jgi:nitroreductase / dihydropteridine reductase
MEYLKALEWRYATKKFDANKKLDQQTFERIISAGNLAASSLGLQLLKVINVVNPETREQLKLASYNQTQVTDASHFIVICGEKTSLQNELKNKCN